MSSSRVGAGTVPILLLVALLVPLLAVAPASGTEVSGTISADTTWLADDGPFIVTADVTVMDGVKLTIETGTVVKFDAGTGLLVQGTLDAKEVEFTSSAQSPTNGAWDGISFLDAEQTGYPFMDDEITYAANAISLDSTNLTVQGGTISDFATSGIYNYDGADVDIRGVTLESTDGNGISCGGPIKATWNHVTAAIAVFLQETCTGVVEDNVITASPTYGVFASAGSEATVRGNLILSTDPTLSQGAVILGGANVTVGGNDIVGHMYGIHISSTTANIDGNSLRSISYIGVFSDVDITVSDTFWGRSTPRKGDVGPVEASNRVTIQDPRDNPIDLVDINQPPSVVITSHEENEWVKDEVLVIGRTYEPEAGDLIDGVEMRVRDVGRSVVEDWLYCNGEREWVCYWYTEDYDTGSYLFDVRAEYEGEEEEEYSVVTTMTLYVTYMAQSKLPLDYPDEVGTDSMTVEWAFDESDGFKYYNVYYSTSPITDTGPLTPVRVDDFSTMSTTLSGLKPGTTYFVVVHAEMDDGRVYRSNQIEVATGTEGGGGGGSGGLFGISTLVLGGILAVVIVVIILVIVFLLRAIKAKDAEKEARQRTVADGRAHQHRPTPQPAPVTAAAAAPTDRSRPYIIEDVFLVYRDGRLIHHDTRRLKPDMDDQMLGGMFTAIQDFIGQSFATYEGDAKGRVKEIMYEDSRIVLEHGDYIFLAVVATDISDTATLHKRMKQLARYIEMKMGHILDGWDGDLNSVADAKRMTKMIFSEGPIGDEGLSPNR